ncbi:MAG: hypothetical protein BJ554DRAFT_3273 [Olpidium bornovanus]|uniref:Mitochondrial pyruvate carrier n=1 Tax=Olpidium bornovanus TaxID=278681 RepID=A0A8H8DFR8_9FUNG|nr:MAG: hypothetical protein BJ554DRAFT_3273 [Olpidium bornovanus]
MGQSRRKSRASDGNGRRDVPVRHGPLGVQQRPPCVYALARARRNVAGRAELAISTDKKRVCLPLPPRPRYRRHWRFATACGEAVGRPEHRCAAAPPVGFLIVETYSNASLRVRVPGPTALAATGIIWSRYSTQIVPINYSLMSVNLFVGATGLAQLYRIWE